MGTRADFYVDRRWIGSLSLDGYPEGAPRILFAGREPRNAFEFEARVYALSGQGLIAPDKGWPWPWQDSSTTDYAYRWNSVTGRVELTWSTSDWMSRADYDKCRSNPDYRRPSRARPGTHPCMAPGMISVPIHDLLDALEDCSRTGSYDRAGQFCAAFEVLMDYGLRNVHDFAPRILAVAETCTDEVLKARYKSLVGG